MKNLVLIALIAVGGFLAWQYLPGLRASVSAKINEYGGWTEAARQSDPVGFIQFARTELEKDIVEFEKAQGELATLRKENEAKLEEYRNLEQTSTTLANQARELYKAAEETGSWPVTLVDLEYDRTKLVAQVDSLLTDKAEAVKLQSKYAEVLDKIEEKASQLRSRLADSRSAVSELEAQESMMKVEKNFEETDARLAKVNALVEGNSKVADDPIRSTQEFAEAMEKEAKAAEKKVESAQALDFLNG